MNYLHRLFVFGILFFFLAASAHAEVITIDSTIKSVDANKRTITVETEGEEKTLDVSSKAKVAIEGKDSTLDKLKAGQKVKLSYHDEVEIVLKIETMAGKEDKDGFVPLFNGKDLTGWQGKVDDPPKIAGMSSSQLKAAQRKANESAKRHWKIKNGVLTYDGGGTSLITAKNYQNFELMMDWKIQVDGDSGVYLRGCPQVQIWDSEKQSANGVGSGGLYNNKRNPSQPSTRADHPVGEWNTFRIRMIGQKVSVWLNDELVVDEVTMENYWYPEQPVFPDGPIELQHYGGLLEFRNIMIKEFN